MPPVSALNDPKLRNVFQRLGEVQAKCDAIVPDKKHTHHNFDYISVQALSNHLRKFCTEAGLKVTASFDPQFPNFVRVDAVNLDDPKDRDTAWYPQIEDDKGHAYSTKYALIRYFNIGDGEEGGIDAPGSNPKPASTPRAAAVNAALGVCPWCGKPAKRNEGVKDSKPYSFIGCTGYPICKWTERSGAPVPVADPVAASLDEAEQMPWLGADK